MSASYQDVRKSGSRSRSCFGSSTGVVPPFDMSLELVAIEVDVAQVAGGIALRLVVEVRRRWIPALTAGGDGSCAHTLPEFDDGHEAVAACAIPLLRSPIGTGTE